MLLSNDLNMYRSVGARIEQLVNEELGLLKAPKRQPISEKGNQISYSYILKEFDSIYLYLRNFGNSFTFEIKDYANGRTVKKENIDMKNIKEIIINSYEELIENRDYNTLIDNIFNMSSITNNKFGTGFGNNNIPF